MATDTSANTNPPLNPSDQFFRYFQSRVTDLQSQFSRLPNTAPSSGERADAVDHCLAGIARLSAEVKDASAYLPAYDQRTYGDAIKALSAKLAEVREQLAPRQKFAFKKGPAFTARKNESAISLSDADDLAAGRVGEGGSSFSTTPVEVLSEDEQGQQQAGAKQLPMHSNKAIALSSHDGEHIILPSSGSSSSASLSLITRCVVDLSTPGTIRAEPLATLTLKSIRGSLIVCGRVRGAAHLTQITDCTIVVHSGQFRMHESRNVDVYLRTSSRPIIEDCSDIRFAPLPEAYASKLEGEGEGVRGGGKDQWDQVDDFKWLKAEPSPNWKVMEAEERVEERVWKEVVPGVPGKGVEDVLAAVGLGKRGR